MIVKIKARILKMTKDDMRTCSSRCIWAELFDENQKMSYKVAWAQSPKVIGFIGSWRSKAQDVFEKTWNECNKGDEVWLYHSDEENFTYFEPIVT